MPDPAQAVKVRARLQCLILCGAVLYFFVNVQRVAVPGTIFDSLQSELNLSAPAVTAIGSTFMYVYAFTQLIVGVLVFRYGGRRVISVGAAIFCAGSLLFAWSHVLWLMYVSRAITGLGAGFIYLGMEQEAHRAYGRRYPLALSLLIMVGYIGGIAASAPFVLIANQVGFRALLVWIGVATCVFYLLYLVARTGLPAQPVREAKIHTAPVKQVLMKVCNRRLYLFGGINFGLYYVLQSVIGKKFLEDYAGLAPTSAAWALFMMGTFSACSGFALVFLSGRAGYRRLLFCRVAGVLSVIVFALMTALIWGSARGSIYAYLFCVLSLTSSLSGIMLPLLRQTNTEETSDIAVSFMNFSLFLFVAIFGNLVGWLMNCFPPERHNDLLIYGRSSYLAVFVVLATFAIVALFCAIRLNNRPGDPVTVALSKADDPTLALAGSDAA